MLPLKTLVTMSRVRFWMYILGPFLVGLAAATTELSQVTTWTIFVWLIYFTFPANFLIYGVNDYADQDTDLLNPKKQGYEEKFNANTKKFLISQILFQTPFLLSFIFLTPYQQGALVAFLFLSLGYSLPPIRAKIRPFLDSIFNGLYFLPGIFAYTLVTNSFPQLEIILAAWLWCMAMHAYSAIPDIQADTKASLNTIATVLKARGTLLFCMFCYLVAAVLIFKLAPILTSSLALMYLTIMAVSYYQLQLNKDIFSIYKIFPLINTISGFGIFVYLIANTSN